MANTPFKMKGWSPFTQKEGIKTKDTRTRGKSGKTYEQRWGELSNEQKAKHLHDIELFKAAGEAYHTKKDIEFEKTRQAEKTVLLPEKK